MHLISDDDSNVEKSDTLKRKVVEEKRQREHILQLNQILAKQVMEKSKMVAGTCRQHSKYDHCMIVIVFTYSYGSMLVSFSFQKRRKNRISLPRSINDECNFTFSIFLVQ